MIETDVGMLNMVICLKLHVDHPNSTVATISKLTIYKISH